MAINFKKLLIVDDSEIDREILKNILCDEFDIIEMDNGYSALEVILHENENLDAILLDLSMPVLDGFDVLRLMNDNNVDNLPIFLITSEATKSNVEKAANYNISEFIRKPFDGNEILKRLRSKLNMNVTGNKKPIPNPILTSLDIMEINKYIEKLNSIYQNYLKNFDGKQQHYMRVSDIMSVLLKQYSEQTKKLDEESIEIISKAAYFYDIGNMAVPNEIVLASSRNEADEKVYQNHTILGSDIIQLNHSPNCRFFVQVCSDICMHHHERYDGKGYPHKLIGNNNSVYTQMCRIANEFDTIFFKYAKRSEWQFDFIMNEHIQGKGIVSEAICTLFMNCKSPIIDYYNS